MHGRVLLGTGCGLMLLVLAAGCRGYAVPNAPAPPGQKPPAAPVALSADAPGPAHPARVPAASMPAAAALHAWDRRRARAWAAGDPAALADLYLGDAGRADVALQRAYLRRGLRVTGMRMQVLAVEVLGHTPNRWRLRVTDRLAHAVAVGHGARVPLPRDAATTRLLTLVRAHGRRWRMARVVPAPG